MGSIYLSGWGPASGGLSPLGAPESGVTPNGAQLSAYGATSGSLVARSRPMGAVEQAGLSDLDQMPACLHRVRVALRSVLGQPHVTVIHQWWTRTKSTTHEENHA